VVSGPRDGRRVIPREDLEQDLDLELEPELELELTFTDVQREGR
jgi:hypothetical protein